MATLFNLGLLSIGFEKNTMDIMRPVLSLKVQAKSIVFIFALHTTRGFDIACFCCVSMIRDKDCAKELCFTV